MSLREYHFFDQVGLMSVGHVCLSLMISSEFVLEPQLDQKKISRAGLSQRTLAKSCRSTQGLLEL